MKPLTLFDVDATPPLTDRQAALLEALQQAGQDGLTTDEAGAILHELKEGRYQHGRDARCQWCSRDGHGALWRLREFGYARYRQRKGNVPGAWLATRKREMQEEIPEDFHPGERATFGQFPAGFGYP